MLITFCVLWHQINSSPPRIACMRQWIESALLNIMACRPFRDKPLSRATANKDCRPVVITEITTLVPYLFVKLLLLIQYQPQAGWIAIFLVSTEGVVFFLALITTLLRGFAFATKCFIFILLNSNQSIALLASVNHINEFENLTLCYSHWIGLLVCI